MFLDPLDYFGSHRGGNVEVILLSTLIFSNQGALGSLLIKLNVQIAVYRRNSVLHHWPVLEVVGVSAITAAVSYLVSFNARVSERCMTLIIHRLFSLGTYNPFLGLIVHVNDRAVLESSLPNSSQIYLWNANRRDQITTGCASVSKYAACSRESDY